MADGRMGRRDGNGGWGVDANMDSGMADGGTWGMMSRRRRWGWRDGDAMRRRRRFVQWFCGRKKQVWREHGVWGDDEKEIYSMQHASGYVRLGTWD